MRFFKFSLFLVLFNTLFNTNQVFAQDTLKFNIKWLNNVPSWFTSDSASGKVLLNFQNAKYNIQGIPTFVELFPVSNNSEVEANIISASFDTIINSKQLSHFTDIPENLSLNVSLLKEEKRNLVQISVIPLLRKDEKVLRLNSFTVVLEKTKTYPVKKSGIERWKNSSILNSGVWKKINIIETGIYKITYSEIKNLGFTDPSKIKLFGNGGKMLPEKFLENESDDLSELPLFFMKGSDGLFNEGDYLIFYATGPVNWNYDFANRKFVHSKHLYTNSINYFITGGENGLVINAALPVTNAEEISTSSFIDYAVLEEDKINLIKSGRNWVGYRFSLQPSKDFTFSFPDPVENSIFSIEGELLARSGSTTNYVVSNNNQVIKNQLVNSVNTGDETSNYADAKTFLTRSNISGKDVTINIKFEKNGDINAEGWLNYLRLNVKRKLKFNGSQLLFRDTSALLQNKTILYKIDNAASNVLIWDVTNLHSVKNISYTNTGSTIDFKAITDTLRNFVVFDPAKALTPTFLPDTLKNVNNQNLHALSNIQMVIISHQNFLAEAEELAEIHRNNDQLTVVTVTPEQVYNEFSSGNPDPAAYRNFMKMLYDKASSPEEMPKYLLLFGDGSYKNNNEKTSESKEVNSNYILTYQSVNSLRPVSSYVSDDYFGLLDDNEGIESGLLDIGIGRLPVSTTSQARAVVNKIKEYIAASSAGSWRNNICFIADDEDGNIHMSQADQISTYLETNFPAVNLIKIFSDAYPQIITSSGARYPEVNKAIENTINKGALIMNYTGHGSETGLAHEQIIKYEEIEKWRNNILPLFITATCEFGRFDDYNITTAGEEVLLNENGGGIGLLTTTRLVYSGPNFVLNQEFYKNFMKKDNDGQYLRLGDILKYTKNSSGTDINKLCFTLLGDPALRLAYPKLQVQTTKINSLDINAFPDTFKAYNEVTVTGNITEANGNLATNFNGIIYPSLFDKEQTVKTLNNDNNSPFIYNQQVSVLYKGKATVKNGEFEFSFVVPREIAYNFGNGKLSYYATDNNTDASGYFNQFIIGGVSTESNLDNEGPAIQLFLNDKNFTNGGLSNQFPLLIADLSDESGINIAGTSIGHNITGILDNNTENTIVLNDYFESEIDNYRKGTISYNISKLEPGKHTLSIKAWDIFNNSSTAVINFEVQDSSKLIISNLHNYPNPFTESTTFVFEHNQPGKTLDAELQVFSVTGSVVYKEKLTIFSNGFTSGPIIWDGKNNYYKKLDKGIYIYRFLFRYNSGEAVSMSKKLVISE